MKHNFHVFRKTKHLKMQDNFIFVDTESYNEQIDNETKNLYFRLGSAIFWNRSENKKQSLIFHDISDFWNTLEKGFDSSHLHYIMFAHNMHFDFKMLNGFKELSKRDWKLTNHYVRNKTYILNFKKDKYSLHVWDTTNYIPQELAEIGKVVGYPKLKIKFDKCNEKELEIYCMRDTEILFVFISQLINFLEEYDLSRLKATASSLSFSAYRHHFYDEDNCKIWIHDFKKAILLERMSYRGGITDNFKIGSCEEVYKLDVNSHYSNAMRNMKLPTKLIYYSHESDKKLIGFDDSDISVQNLTDLNYQEISEKLMTIYDQFKKTHGIIARVTVYIPKKYAYILNDFGLGKTSFAWGKSEIVLCTPELDFIEKYGKILQVHEINVYEVKYLAREFVDFFYGLKREFDMKGNLVYRAITKIFLNGYYGKWGQKEYKTERLDDKHDYLIRNQDLILDIINDKIDIIQNNSIVYLGSINGKEIYVIDNKLYLSYQTNNNSKESFVAISSFTTSKARMNLVEYILIAQRKNVFYTDTDSLFTNQKGFDILLQHECIDDYEMGKLKKEGLGSATFYNPKFYDFQDYEEDKMHRKCKGIRQKDAVLLNENKFMVEYQVEQWDKFKSDMKKGFYDNQLIHLVKKVMSKKYDKGIITRNNYIEPYHIEQIKNMN